MKQGGCLPPLGPPAQFTPEDILGQMKRIPLNAGREFK